MVTGNKGYLICPNYKTGQNKGISYLVKEQLGLQYYTSEKMVSS